MLHSWLALKIIYYLCLTKTFESFSQTGGDFEAIFCIHERIETKPAFARVVDEIAVPYLINFH